MRDETRHWGPVRGTLNAEQRPNPDGFGMSSGADVLETCVLCGAVITQETESTHARWHDNLVARRYRTEHYEP